MARSLRKVFTGRNVLEAAKGRCRDIFMEYDDKVFVSFSGGKDSTVIFNLMADAVEEMGYLPLKVIFVDQEADWQGTVEIMRVVMDDPRVHPIRGQVPFKVFHETSYDGEWLFCWEPGSWGGSCCRLLAAGAEETSRPVPRRSSNPPSPVGSGPRRRSAGCTYPGPRA